MAVELGERQGPSLTWWLDRPFAFALFVYRHLQEIDRRAAWTARMTRIDAAQLTAMGFHEPPRLRTEYAAALADAGPSAHESRHDLLAFGRRLAHDVDATGVLQ